MKVFYKATTIEGRDFHTGTVDYAAAFAAGERIRINGPTRTRYECCTSDVLHAADAPTETLIGCWWPCRLFEVTGRPVAQEGHKFGFRSLKVEREVEAPEVFGPQGKQIAALIDAAGKLTSGQVDGLRARDAAWDAARDAAWDAARDAARDAAWGAAWDAARSASGLLVRDLIGTGSLTQDHYDALTRAWREVVGPLHEDDADLRVGK